MSKYLLKHRNLCRIFVFALACLLVATSLPASSFLVFAEEPEEAQELQQLDLPKEQQEDQKNEPVENGGTAEQLQNDQQTDQPQQNKSDTVQQPPAVDAQQTVPSGASNDTNNTRDGGTDNGEDGNNGDDAVNAGEGNVAGGNEPESPAQEDEEEESDGSETVTLTVQKVWEEGDSEARIPRELVVHLIRIEKTGTETVTYSLAGTYTLNANDNWSKTVDVAAPASNVSYTWTEDSPAGWLLTKNVTDNNKTVITNTPTEQYDPRTVYTGTKTWEGDTSSLPDDLTITLNWEYTDDTETKSGTVYVDTNGLPSLEDKGQGKYPPVWENKNTTSWTYTFGNLPVFSETGAYIEYTAEETEAEGFTLTNKSVKDTKYVIGFQGFKPKKVPNCNIFSFDIDDQNSLIFFDVLKGNEEVIWTPRPLLNAEKEALLKVLPTHHTVSTITAWLSGVPYYYLPEGHGHSGKNISFGIVGGKAHIEFPAHCDWSMFYYGEIGLSETYTPGSTDFTNTIDPTPEETVSVTVTKVWDDNNNANNTRPDSITVNLLAGAAIVESVQIAENGIVEPAKAIVPTAADAVEKAVEVPAPWSYTFKDLPKVYEDGTAIEYSVTEARVEGYQDPVITAIEGGFKITNTITPPVTPPDETIDITVKKNWADDNDAAGKRPESITVRLFANGEYVVDTMRTVDEKDEWQVTYKGLPLKDGADKDIEYSVEEAAVAGYTTAIKKDETGKVFTITNTITPPVTPPTPTIDIPVEKIWEGDEHHLNGRPASITVVLMNGEKEVKQITIPQNDEVTPSVAKDAGEVVRKVLRAEQEEETDTSWKGTFYDVPKYDEDGEEIAYTIKELELPDYISEVTGDAEKGFTITNKYKWTDVYVMKVWDDNDDEREIRPESITVTLLADGEEVQTAEVVLETSENDEPYERAPRREIEAKAATGTIYANAQDGDWYFTFGHLPRFDENGKEIEYSIEELVPDNYIATITQETDTFDGETYTYWKIVNECSLTDVYAMKVWDDNDNAREVRPETITVTLLADNKEVLTEEVVPVERIPIPVDDQPVLRAVTPEEKDDDEQTGTIYAPVVDGTWRFAFSDLPKYDEEGNAITYTLSERVPDKYRVTITQKTETFGDETITYWEIKNTYATNTPPDDPTPNPGPKPEPSEDPTEEPIDDPDTPLAPPTDGDTDIDDPDTPLAPVEEETEIEDEETPLTPFTGDNRHTRVWAGISLASLIGIVLLGKRRRYDAKH